MAKTYSAVVTAQAANIAFQIEVSTVGTINIWTYERYTYI